MLKLFASDLDGTLLNFEGKSDAVVLEAIDAVTSNDKLFVIATGRPRVEVIVEEGFTDRELYILCLNGALCYHPDGTLLFDDPLDPSFVEDLIDTFPEYTFEFCDERYSYAMCNEEELVYNLFTNTGFKDKTQEARDHLLDSFKERFTYGMSKEEILSKTIYKVNVPMEVGEHKLLAFMKNYPTVCNQPSISDIYELTGSACTKGKGILRLASMLQIKEEEIVVFGDGNNDVSMLSMFKHSYAPHTACKEALEVSTTIVDRSDEHAIPMVIKTLIEEGK